MLDRAIRLAARHRRSVPVSHGLRSEKTEKPTAKRLEGRAQEGQVARSRDLAMAAASVAATIALAALGGRVVIGAQRAG